MADTTIDTTKVLAEYERIARANRAADWPAFVTEAKADPPEIAWEVIETAEHAGHEFAEAYEDTEFDAVWNAALKWVADLAATDNEGEHDASTTGND